MWKQLTLVKEARGKLGILATQCALYRTIANEGFNLVDHISKLRKLQEDLHLMGSIVADEDFAMILVSSLPESWDLYTSAYLGSKTDGSGLTSHGLVAILLEEDRRWRGRNRDPDEVALHTRDSGKASGTNSDKEWYNCHKKGHLVKDCWAKGGGKESQGPRGRRKGRGDGRNKNWTHQASDVINNSLADISYTVNTHTLSCYSWVLVSGTTSHICNLWDAFGTDYKVLTDATVQGIGKTPAQAVGRGTITVNFTVNGQTISHRLREVLYIPEARNSLLSISRFDESGGDITFKAGTHRLSDKNKGLVRTGLKSGRLYLLDARAQLNGNEHANVVALRKPSWDEWHCCYGHLGITRLETLKSKQLVDGMEVDKSTVPSQTSKACIQAKQAVRPFPKEAEHKSKVPGERTLSDIWGPAWTESISGSKYYISFNDDATWTCATLFMKTKDGATRWIK
jgi:hypothetical protein